jgi:hypothetical protein
LSTRTLEEAIHDPYSDARLLSRPAVSQISDSLREDYQAFCQRDLSDLVAEYLLVDAVCENLRRAGKVKEALLCAWGICRHGRIAELYPRSLRQRRTLSAIAPPTCLHGLVRNSAAAPSPSRVSGTKSAASPFHAHSLLGTIPVSLFRGQFSVVGIRLAKHTKLHLNGFALLGLLAYFACVGLLGLTPFNTQLWPLYAGLILLTGLYPGVFFVRLSGYYTARQLFFSENNGFIIGLAGGTVLFLLWGRSALWGLPVLVGILAMWCTSIFFNRVRMATSHVWEDSTGDGFVA